MASAPPTAATSFWGWYAAAPPPQRAWEQWEPVGEWAECTMPGRWWGRSSSSDGVPGAPFRDDRPMMESGDAPGDAERERANQTAGLE